MQILDNKNYGFTLSLMLVIAFSILLIIFTYFNKAKIGVSPKISYVNSQKWRVRSIDTMKYSRDLARIKMNDAAFNKEIDDQISKIAAAGANYVAIGTPYDTEFVPFIKRWVESARKYNLHVWFRGNFSGWEGWFDYSRIDRATHIEKTKQFILENRDLFQEGDIFTPCPECENGLNSHPNNPEAIREYRSFLITEYNAAKKAFQTIGKKVETGYFSMNGDVARAIMDKETTRALGGIVVIDHYVLTPQKLAEDIREFTKQSRGKVMLGEFGAPIPDIHGKMTENQQNEWLHEALTEISPIRELIGINYWVNKGGATALWNDDGTEKKAVHTIRDFFK